VAQCAGYDMGVQGFRSAVGLVEVLKRSEKSGIWVTCVYGCVVY